MRGTAVVDGPLVEVVEPAPLEIMQYQVSVAEYGLCVADGACRKAEPRRRGSGNVAVTGVSFDDATDYAAWLSHRTGETWRLPTVGEWAFAAGSKARDHALDRATDEKDPAQRWLAYYKRDAALAAGAQRVPQPLGTFGANEYGVFDLAEAVWEWTATCGGRTILGAAGETLSHLEFVRRPPAGGPAPHADQHLRARCAGRRLQRRRAAGQSRLPAGAGAPVVGTAHRRLISRPAAPRAAGRTASGRGSDRRPGRRRCSRRAPT